MRRWYRLDNAANLYPAIRNRRIPAVFRISAELDQKIDPKELQSALDTTIRRLPIFAVKLRAGLFWHYFMFSGKKITVQEDVSNPCMEMTRGSTKGFLIRVRYHHNVIALEVFHSITDGQGALIFLKTLVAQYLIMQGSRIPAVKGVLDGSQQPNALEIKDNFRSFAKNSPTRTIPKERAFHIRGTFLGINQMKMIKGVIPFASLKLAAKAFGVTITEYLAAAYLKVLNEHQLEHTIRVKIPVKVQVPVNLRKYANSDTLRNFSAFVTPSINPLHGEYKFKEIIALVHHYLRYEITEKHLRAQVAGNIRYANHPLIRILPLFLKNRLINLVYQLTGPSSFTSVLSNLGKIELPSEMQAHVRSIDFVLGATPKTNISCAVLGYQDNINIIFSRVIYETDIERRFFSFLVEQGIQVQVENYQE